jgi:hypothetical protein
MAYKNIEDKNKYAEQWRKNHSDYMSRYMKKYYRKNKEEILKRKKQWLKNNPERERETREEYYKNNSGKIKEISKQWRKDNPEKIKEWRKDNPEKIKEYINQWTKQRQKTDLKFNLNFKMRRAICESLKGNKAGRRWESLVGYTLADLIKRLNETMPVGYTWQDFLQGKFHIDHIIPISAFNFTRPEHTDFKRCWALSNLRLLPAKENLIKGAKLSKPFQPALRI